MLELVFQLPGRSKSNRCGWVGKRLLKGLVRCQKRLAALYPLWPQLAILPDRDSIKSNRRINNVERDLAGRVTPASMKMQQTWIAKGSIAPAIKVGIGRSVIGAARMNARVPGVDKVPLKIEKSSDEIIVCFRRRD